MNKVVDHKKLFIDIGAPSKEEARKLVKPGDFAVFNTSYTEIGGDDWSAVRGKAFDDRAGCAVLIELLNHTFPFDLYAVFTAQEEVGLRGAHVAAFSIEPDCAFVIETTGAHELPSKKEQNPSTKLGYGPAITIMDKSVISDRHLVDILVDTAARFGIRYQIKQPGIGGTDAGAIQSVKRGVPAVTVSIPCRYIHSPASILSLNDLDSTVRLLKETLHRLTENFSR